MPLPLLIVLLLYSHEYILTFFLTKGNNLCCDHFHQERSRWHKTNVSTASERLASLTFSFPNHVTRPMLKAEILKGLLWTVRVYCFPTSSPFVISIAITAFLSSLLRSQGRCYYSPASHEHWDQRRAAPTKEGHCPSVLMTALYLQRERSWAQQLSKNQSQTLSMVTY